ncbi:helix-turn-helix domain-containing protein [Agathobacter sp.]
MDFDYTTMGNRIRLRRKELHLTQSDFSKKLGISQNHISAIECGTQHLSFELFISICDTLHINPDYLINGCTHTTNTPLQIMNSLNLCDKSCIELARRFAELLVELYPNEDKQK